MATLTTTSGSTFITTETTLPNGNAAVRAVPGAWDGSSALPFVLYCHGAGGAYDQFTTLAAWSGLRTWLVDQGFGWVECAGDGDNWGGLGGRTAYEQAYQQAAAALPLAAGKVVVIGRSMGGLVSAWLATQSSVVAPQAAAWLCSSGVVNLEHRYAVYSGDNSKLAMRRKYGAVDDADFLAKSAAHDPMKFPLSVWSGKKVLNLVGTNDTNVAPAMNGTMLRDRLQGTVAVNGYDARQGGDHGTVNGTYFQVAAMSAFIAEAVGLGSVEPVQPVKAVTISGLFAADASRALIPLRLPGAPA